MAAKNAGRVQVADNNFQMDLSELFDVEAEESFADGEDEGDFDEEMEGA